jgi:hypothetical protein
MTAPHARPADRDTRRRAADESIVHEVMISGRTVGRFTRAYPGPGEPSTGDRHTHCTDQIVAYVIRVTADEDGRTYWRDHTGTPAQTQQHPGRCGYDADVVTRTTPESWTEAKTRAARHGHAMVDSLFSCGCRI